MAQTKETCAATEWNVAEYGVSEWGCTAEYTADRVPTPNRPVRDGQRRPRTARPTKLPGFPKPPAEISVNLRQYLNSITEALEVRLGRKGDPRDAAVTFRDLLDSGLALEFDGSAIRPAPGGDNSNPGGGGPPGDGGPTEDPTAPTGFRVTAAMYNISLFWNAARYEYAGHGYTEIWRADAIIDPDTGEEIGTPILNVDGDTPAESNDAYEVGTSIGTTYTDPTGPARIYYYWIRHVNEEGVKGPWALPYPNGLRAETVPDPEFINELFDQWLQENGDQLLEEILSQIDLDGLIGYVGYDQYLDQGDGALTLWERMGIVEYWQNDGDGEWYTFQAQYTKEITLLHEEDAILAKDIETLAATIGDGGEVDLSAVIQRLDIIEGDISGIHAQHVVKIQTSNSQGTYVAGYGLAVEQPVAGPATSIFAIAATAFAIIEPEWYPSDADIESNPDVLEPYIPFKVLTQPEIINGIEIPAGVYIKDAFINEAYIKSLVAGSVVADYISAGAIIETPNIFAGTFNMGYLEKTDVEGNELPIEEWYIADPDKRVGNFSVDADGYMHARGASLYEISIYDEDGNELIFNVNGIDGTYIKDATITTAKIKTANIETLLLAGDAVTIPRGVAGGGIEITSGTRLLGSVTLSYVPAMVDVTGALVDIRPKTVIVNAHIALESSLAGTYATFFLDVEGTSVEAVQASGLQGGTTLMFTYMDTPPESDSTFIVNRRYRLYCRKEVTSGPGGSGDLDVYRFGMTVMGGKR